MEVKKMNNYCCNTRDCATRCQRDCGNAGRCYTIVLAVIGVLFALVIGLIIGAALAGTILAALPAVIAAAVILAVLFVVFLILRICNSNRSCGC